MQIIYDYTYVTLHWKLLRLFALICLHKTRAFTSYLPVYFWRCRNLNNSVDCGKRQFDVIFDKSLIEANFI